MNSLAFETQNGFFRKGERTPFKNLERNKEGIGHGKCP